MDAYCTGTAIRDFHNVADESGFDETMVMELFGAPPDDAMLVFDGATATRSGRVRPTEPIRQALMCPESPLTGPGPSGPILVARGRHTRCRVRESRISWELRRSHHGIRPFIAVREPDALAKPRSSWGRPRRHAPDCPLQIAPTRARRTDGQEPAPSLCCVPIASGSARLRVPPAP